ncbi:unnamed protein product [Phytophthora fragariaefolia]|uniref:Unnamed protein product n=1 Tax=Phytophthora fragariaefolia TaxID=1490495 RepID=A0A9W6XHT5_9STRA|nr:unnamed protein product [Phytophthora fragariaefolia]
MNLFLALLLDNFEAAAKSILPKDSRKLSKQLSVRTVKVSPASTKKRLSGTDDMMAHSAIANAERHQCRKPPQPNDVPRSSACGETTISTHGTNAYTSKNLLDIPQKRYNGPDAQHVTFANFASEETFCGKSLYLFGPNNKIRRWTARLSTHPIFNSAMLGLIIASSIVLALENPLHDPESMLMKVLLTLDKVFAVVFLFEMVIKVVSLGLVMNEGAYLRSPWNVIDAFVAILSTVVLFAHVSPTNSTAKSLLSLRDLRTLRPLRMISRRPGLKLVVSALVESIPAVLNVVFLCMALFLLFSIAAVNFLKGTFRACSGDVFDALLPEQKAFLVSPTPWDELSDVQRG